MLDFSGFTLLPKNLILSSTKSNFYACQLLEVFFLKKKINESAHSKPISQLLVINSNVCFHHYICSYYNIYNSLNIVKSWSYYTLVTFFQAKKKVALLLQKLKKYELPDLPAPRHDPELLTAEQLQAYKKIGFRNRNYVPVGVRGVFGGVVQNMHMHWKFHETVQVCCDNFPKEKIKEMAAMLTRLSGGIVINIHNTKTIIMFRGRNYRQPKNLIPLNTLTKRKVSFLQLSCLWHLPIGVV